jgi:DNA anti-recombination protein RmuC
VSPEFVIAVLLAILLGLGIGFVLSRRLPSSPEAPPAPDPRLDQLLNSLPQLYEDLGTLKTKVAQLPTADAVSGVQRELTELKAGFRDVDKKVPATFAADLQALGGGLDKLVTQFQERGQRDEDTRVTLQRIAAVVAGAQSRGGAGEAVLAEAFAQFPPEMADTQFKVSGKPVEFALILPSKKRLPIDSKWPAVKELEQYSQEENEAVRQELLGKIEKAVLKKVEEVTKYLDAAKTANVAVAAVPDAAYFACRTAHIDAYRQRVLLMPYSLTIPFLLALYNLHMQFARSVEQENLDAYLSQFDALLNQFDEKLENSVQRGAVMISNAYLELKAGVGEMRRTVATLRGLPTESLAETQESLLKE